MVISGLMRLKCYTILEGLERSLGENLTRNFDTTKPGFYTDEELQRALKRMREDLGEQALGINDVYIEDVLEYLDLGDLLGLLNRHAVSAKNILPEHIKRATEVVNQSDALRIRKRVMHPIRPLELDDFQRLSKLAEDIQKVAPSLTWSPLAIGVRRINRRELNLDREIPTHWVEEPPIVQNLPPAEFDETGFIGRRKERKDVKHLLESEHRVITVVGEGGIGKTALSLRVCNDLLEENSKLFDRITWVSLKTRYLTPDGIRDIQNAIDSVGYLIQSITQILTKEEDIRERQGWVRVAEQMQQTKTLLVIDNLETIGAGIRDLALQIPANSKLLLTSRVGLGEIEVRYELSSFMPKDAMTLFRIIASIHNFAALTRLPERIVHNYTQSLHFNPLLIKWFVLAVGGGGDPVSLLKGQNVEEPLVFCYENVYEHLGNLEQGILATMLAARRELTNAQLMELTGTESITLVTAIQNLVRSSMVQRVTKEDGSIALQLGGLVHEYLKRKHPPENGTVTQVRSRIKQWQIEQDKITVQSAIYRYSHSALQAKTADERISAQHLMRALRAIRASDFPTAESAVSRAEQITPTWWEVYRVKARLLELLSRPIYEIEDAYEQSINCDDNDVNRYHYAAYLIGIDEHDRALEQIDIAKTSQGAHPMVLDSLRGIALMRLGKSDEAIQVMKYVWDNRSKELPARVSRIQGTQLAEAYRRDIESLRVKEMPTDALENFSAGTGIVDECLNLYGCDGKLVDVAIDLVGTALSVLKDHDKAAKHAAEVGKRWENSDSFMAHAKGREDIVGHFMRTPDLTKYFPLLADVLLASDRSERGQRIPKGDYSGTIEGLVQRRDAPYGFISCDQLGSVYFSKQSLLNETDWGTLTKGTKVKFDIVSAEKPFKPRAISLRLDSS